MGHVSICHHASEKADRLGSPHCRCSNTPRRPSNKESSASYVRSSGVSMEPRILPAALQGQTMLLITVPRYPRVLFDAGMRRKVESIRYCAGSNAPSAVIHGTLGSARVFAVFIPSNFRVCSCRWNVAVPPRGVTADAAAASSLHSSLAAGPAQYFKQLPPINSRSTESAGTAVSSAIGSTLFRRAWMRAARR